MSAVDAVIVGAGPAGLAAAIEVAARGLSVTVFDEYPVAGGRLLGQRYRLGRRTWNGREVADRLLEAALGQPSLALRMGTTVFSVTARESAYAVRTAPGGETVTARAVLIATGASERPLPMPGWTLPGVMTVGAAQVLSVVHGVKPGRRGLIVGMAPLSFAIAAELKEADVDVAAVVMPRPGDPTRHLGSFAEQWRALSTMRRAAPAWVRPGASLLGRETGRRLLLRLYPPAGVRIMNTPVRLTHAAVQVLGRDRAEALELAPIRPDGTLTPERVQEPVDFVLLSGGLSPLTDLVVPLGVAMEAEPALGGMVPVTGPGGETTVPGVYVAGNAGGVESGAVALAQGRAAGITMAAGLDPDRSSALRSARREALTSLQETRRTAPFSFMPGAGAALARMAERWSALQGGPGSSLRGGS